LVGQWRLRLFHSDWKRRPREGKKERRKEGKKERRKEGKKEGSPSP
jgi:hypothetical protein